MPLKSQSIITSDKKSKKDAVVLDDASKKDQKKNVSQSPKKKPE